MSSAWALAASAAKNTWSCATFVAKAMGTPEFVSSVNAIAYLLLCGGVGFGFYSGMLGIGEGAKGFGEGAKGFGSYFTPNFEAEKIKSLAELTTREKVKSGIYSNHSSDKELEFSLIRRSISDKKRVISHGLASIREILEPLDDLRGSPFFKDEYRPEYNMLFYFAASDAVNDSKKIKCKDLIEKFNPAYKKVGAFQKCEKDVKGDVPFIDLIDSLCSKLPN